MYRKNTAGQFVYFALINATNGSALTGATVTAYRALANGAQAAATGTTTELGNGQYRFALSQADTDADYGSYLFTATNAVPVEKTVVFTAANPQDGAAFGLSRIDDAITSRLAASSYTAPLNASATAAAVWDALLSSYTVAGSFGARVLRSTGSSNAINASATGGVLVVGDMFGNNLVIPNLATQSQIPAEFTSATFASTGVFATAALVNAPGGGGGGTDWTANERTAIRSILGFNSGGTVALPTVGVLDAIKDKTDLISAGGSVTTNSPVTTTGSVRPIVIGDDYLAANGRAFSWTLSAIAGITPGTATAYFGGTSTGSPQHTFLVTGTVTDNGNGTWTVSCDMPRATSATLLEQQYEWTLGIQAAGGTRVTPVRWGERLQAVESHTW